MPYDAGNTRTTYTLQLGLWYYVLAKIKAMVRAM